MRATLLTALVCAWVLLVSAPQEWTHVVQAGVFLLGAVGAVLAAGKPPRLWIPLAAASLWPWLQLALHTSAYPERTLEAGLGWGANLVIFLLAAQMSRGERQRCRLMLLYFGVAVAAVAAMQFFTSQGKIFWVFPTQYTDEVMGPFVSRDHYAAFIELVLPLAVVEALREPRTALRHSVMAAALFASVIEGASRAGALLVTAEIAVLMLPAVRRARATLVKVAALAAVFTLVAGGEVLWRRFDDPDPWRYRREMSGSALEMARERPAAGFGLNTFETVYPAYARFDVGLVVNHAHNDWAEWAAEGGLPFLLLLAWIGVGAVRLAVEAPWAVGVVSVLVHSAVDFPMQKPALAALLFLLLGMAAATGPPKRERIKSSLCP